jgi:threonine synthase
MDISKASNFERFVYDLLDQDAAQLATLWRQVDSAGGFTLSAEQMRRVREHFGFCSGRSSHQNRLDTIRQVYDTYGIVIDTHTADGVKVAREHLQAGVPMVVLETALPAKFTETIELALGQPAPRPSGFEQMESLPQRFEVMEPDVAGVKAFIQRHTGIQ